MKVTISSRPAGRPDDGWGPYLAPGEVLLWDGRPEYGRRLFEFVGAERAWHLGFLIGTVALWLTWPLIEDDGSLTKGDAIWVYGALTLGFLIAAFYLAAARSYLLDSLHYAVTDRRAIVRREGRNHVLASRAYLVSCEHSSEFPYHIAEGRPHPSLTVGALLSEDVVQPFGYGLTHPGWGPLRDRGVIPVLFEQIADAEAVRALLLATSDASAAGQP